MEIRFISSLTAEDENAFAPALLKAVGALLDQMPIAYTIRIETTGAQVFQGPLVQRPDFGYTYSPTPYQKVYEADFSAFNSPGEYRLVVPGLGGSLPFMIHDGVAMAFARAYALGLYHQRCGTNTAMPFTRFTHDVCHSAPAAVVTAVGCVRVEGTASRAGRIGAAVATSAAVGGPQSVAFRNWGWPALEGVAQRGTYDFIRRCLAENPQERPADGQALVAEIAALMKEAGVTAPITVTRPAMLGPNSARNMTATKNTGKASTTSVTRISAASGQPPK